MNIQEQDHLKKDIDDLLSLVRIQNLYTIHYFFADDVDEFYKNASRYVAIVENGTQVDKRVFNQVISRMRATNKHCSIDRISLRNLFSHPRHKISFLYSVEVKKLVDAGEIQIFNHGSLKTKAMDEREHFARLFFIPKHALQNYLANFDSIEDAFKDAKQQASKRVRNRIEKKIGEQEPESVLLLDRTIELMEKVSKMKLTKPQENAIEKRLALIEKFTAEIKALFEGKNESDVSTFSDSEMQKLATQKDALTVQPKAVAVPKKQAAPDTIDDIPDIPDDPIVETKPKNQWIADLEKRLPELVEKNLSPSFANGVGRIFRLKCNFGTQNLPCGASGSCDYGLQNRLTLSILKAYSERRFEVSEVDESEWSQFRARARSLGLAG